MRRECLNTKEELGQLSATFERELEMQRLERGEVLRQLSLGTHAHMAASSAVQSGPRDPQVTISSTVRCPLTELGELSGECRRSKEELFQWLAASRDEWLADGIEQREELRQLASEVQAQRWAASSLWRESLSTKEELRQLASTCRQELEKQRLDRTDMITQLSLGSHAQMVALSPVQRESRSATPEHKDPTNVDTDFRFDVVELKAEVRRTREELGQLLAAPECEQHVDRQMLQDCVFQPAFGPNEARTGGKLWPPMRNVGDPAQASLDLADAVRKELDQIFTERRELSHVGDWVLEVVRSELGQVFAELSKQQSEESETFEKQSAFDACVRSARLNVEEDPCASPPCNPATSLVTVKAELGEMRRECLNTKEELGQLSATFERELEMQRLERGDVLRQLSLGSPAHMAASSPSQSGSHSAAPKNRETTNVGTNSELDTTTCDHHVQLQSNAIGELRQTLSELSEQRLEIVAGEQRLSRLDTYVNDIVAELRGTFSEEFALTNAFPQRAGNLEVAILPIVQSRSTELGELSGEVRTSKEEVLQWSVASRQERLAGGLELREKLRQVASEVQAQALAASSQHDESQLHSEFVKGCRARSPVTVRAEIGGMCEECLRTNEELGQLTTTFPRELPTPRQEHTDIVTQPSFGLNAQMAPLSLPAPQNSQPTNIDTKYLDTIRTQMDQALAELDEQHSQVSDSVEEQLSLNAPLVSSSEQLREDIDVPEKTLGEHQARSSKVDEKTCARQAMLRDTTIGDLRPTLSQLSEQRSESAIGDQRLSTLDSDVSDIVAELRAAYSEVWKECLSTKEELGEVSEEFQQEREAQQQHRRDGITQPPLSGSRARTSVPSPARSGSRSASPGAELNLVFAELRAQHSEFFDAAESLTALDADVRRAGAELRQTIAELSEQRSEIAAGERRSSTLETYVNDIFAELRGPISAECSSTNALPQTDGNLEVAILQVGRSRSGELGELSGEVRTSKDEVVQSSVASKQERLAEGLELREKLRQVAFEVQAQAYDDSSQQDESQLHSEFVEGCRARSPVAVGADLGAMWKECLRTNEELGQWTMTFQRGLPMQRLGRIDMVPQLAFGPNAQIAVLSPGVPQTREPTNIGTEYLDTVSTQMDQALVELDEQRSEVSDTAQKRLSLNASVDNASSELREDVDVPEKASDEQQTRSSKLDNKTCADQAQVRYTAMGDLRRTLSEPSEQRMKSAISEQRLSRLDSDAKDIVVELHVAYSDVWNECLSTKDELAEFSTKFQHELETQQQHLRDVIRQPPLGSQVETGKPSPTRSESCSRSPVYRGQTLVGTVLLDTVKAELNQVFSELRVQHSEVCDTDERLTALDADVCRARTELRDLSASSRQFPARTDDMEEAEPGRHISRPDESPQDQRKQLLQRANGELPKENIEQSSISQAAQGLNDVVASLQCREGPHPAHELTHASGGAAPQTTLSRAHRMSAELDELRGECSHSNEEAEQYSSESLQERLNDSVVLKAEHDQVALEDLRHGFIAPAHQVESLFMDSELVSAPPRTQAHAVGTELGELRGVFLKILQELEMVLAMSMLAPSTSRSELVELVTQHIVGPQDHHICCAASTQNDWHPVSPEHMERPAAEELSSSSETTSKSLAWQAEWTSDQLSDLLGECAQSEDHLRRWLSTPQHVLQSEKTMQSDGFRSLSAASDEPGMHVSRPGRRRSEMLNALPVVEQSPVGGLSQISAEETMLVKAKRISMELRAVWRNLVLASDEEAQECSATSICEPPSERLEAMEWFRRVPEEANWNERTASSQQAGPRLDASEPSDHMCAELCEHRPDALETAESGSELGVYVREARWPLGSVHSASTPRQSVDCSYTTHELSELCAHAREAAAELRDLRTEELSLSDGAAQMSWDLAELQLECGSARSRKLTQEFADPAAEMTIRQIAEDLREQRDVLDGMREEVRLLSAERAVPRSRAIQLPVRQQPMRLEVAERRLEVLATEVGRQRGEWSEVSVELELQREEGVRSERVLATLSAELRTITSEEGSVGGCKADRDDLQLTSAVEEWSAGLTELRGALCRAWEAEDASAAAAAAMLTLHRAQSEEFAEVSVAAAAASWAKECAQNQDIHASLCGDIQTLREHLTEVVDDSVEMRRQVLILCEERQGHPPLLALPRRDDEPCGQHCECALNSERLSRLSCEVAGMLAAQPALDREDPLLAAFRSRLERTEVRSWDTIGEVRSRCADLKDSSDQMQAEIDRLVARVVAGEQNASRGLSLMQQAIEVLQAQQIDLYQRAIGLVEK